MARHPRHTLKSSTYQRIRWLGYVCGNLHGTASKSQTQVKHMPKDTGHLDTELGVVAGRAEGDRGPQRPSMEQYPSYVRYVDSNTSFMIALILT